MAKFVGFPKCISGWYNTHRGPSAQLCAAELLRQDLDARGVPHTEEIEDGIRHLSESWRDEFRAATRQPLLEQMLRILIRLRGPIRLGLGLIALVLCGALGVLRGAGRGGLAVERPRLFAQRKDTAPRSLTGVPKHKTGKASGTPPGALPVSFFCAKQKPPFLQRGTAASVACCFSENYRARVTLPERRQRVQA
ncbi:hypothetical protein B5F36_11340 [Anaerofilum sp. An201]|nr:hypothetical protein [Anaerofilum sp. An201]OUP02303.1 hypothetical protein B5F36_11340 [Anaerofilum sp. An201]